MTMIRAETSEQDTMVIPLILFSILALVVVVLRIKCRRMTNRGLDSSDYCIMAAVLFAWVNSALLLAAVFAGGVGLHLEDVVKKYGMKPLITFTHLIVPIQIFRSACSSLFQMSILFLYIRVFTNRYFSIIARINLVVVGCWAITVFIMSLSSCTITVRGWEHSSNKRCLGAARGYTVLGPVFVVTELITLILPLPLLVSLQIPLGRKLTLFFVFALGILTFIMGVLRVVHLPEMVSGDFTYASVQTLVFSGLEPLVGIIVACIPLLRPLLGLSSYSATGTAVAVTRGKLSEAVHSITTRTRMKMNSTSSTATHRGRGSSVANPTIANNMMDRNESQQELQPVHLKERTGAQRWRQVSVDAESGGTMGLMI